jgi:hypothetical protein
MHFILHRLSRSTLKEGVDQQSGVCSIQCIAPRIALIWIQLEDRHTRVMKSYQGLSFPGIEAQTSRATTPVVRLEENMRAFDLAMPERKAEMATSLTRNAVMSKTKVEKAYQNRELSVGIRAPKLLISYLPIRVTDASTRVQRTPFVPTVALDERNLLVRQLCCPPSWPRLAETESHQNRMNASLSRKTQNLID